MNTIHNPIIGNNNETQICQICTKQYKKYVCPRCNLQYCSKTCYQSKKHKCAETFFKENFMNLLKGEKASDSSRNEIIQILRKLEEEDTNELEYEKESGSESEDDIADRFSELNLDNMNIEAIWNKLNDKEKKQFNDLLSNPKELNSQLDEIVIPWKPWWEYKQNNKENKKIIIEEMGNVQKQDITTSNNKNNSLYFPSLNDSIQKLSNTSNKPKVFLGYNLIDILLTYVYVTRYFNGEIYDYIKETCEIIWELTTILENDLQYNFNNIEEILESKNINFQKKQIIYNFEHTIMNIEDTINILNSRENILLVLSDLIKIFTIYQEYIKEEKKKKKEKKEQYNHLNSFLKKGFKTEKKIYYYLCYVNTEEILTDDLIDILIHSLELKNEELKKIKNDISENKSKYEKIKIKNNSKKVLIEEL